jgi:hypothetical protein
MMARRSLESAVADGVSAALAGEHAEKTLAPEAHSASVAAQGLARWTGEKRCWRQPQRLQWRRSGEGEERFLVEK